MIKKINHKKITAVIPSIVFLFTAIPTYALEYIKLEPDAFPGITASSDLTVFLSQVFNFGIAATVALSLVMIIWGGIIYMTTDSWNGKEDGKAKITNALYGLGLALISWLLLYTINPCLVDFSGKAGCEKANTLLNVTKQSSNTNTSSQTQTVGTQNSQLQSQTATPDTTANQNINIPKK